MKKYLVALTIGLLLCASLTGATSYNWRTGKPVSSSTAAVQIPYIKDNFDYLKAWMDRVMLNDNSTADLKDGINVTNPDDVFLFHPFYATDSGRDSTLFDNMTLADGSMFFEPDNETLWIYLTSAWHGLKIDEAADARGSAASLDARLDVSFEEDGSIKSSPALSEWVTSGYISPTKVSDVSFTVQGDKTAKLTQYRRVALDTTYCEVVSSSYGAGDNKTTVTVKASCTVPATITSANYALISANSSPYKPDITPIGADGTTLVADSTQTHGVTWRATPNSGRNYISNSGFGVWSTATATNTGSAVAEDDCNDDSTAGWTISVDGVLAFVNTGVPATSYYTVTTDTADSFLKGSLSVTKDKIYKVVVYIKDGTASSKNVQLFFDDGSSNYSNIQTTTATSAALTYYFKSAATSSSARFGISIPTSLSGGNIRIDNFSVYEVVPAETSTNTKASNGHSKTSTVDATRDVTNSTYYGSMYAAKLTKGANTAEYYNLTNRTDNAWVKQFAGKTVTLGCYVYASQANNVKVQINDSTSTTESSYATVTTKQWIEATRTLGASITSLTPRILLDGNTSDVAYISEPIFIVGSYIGEGNYNPMASETIPVDVALTLPETMTSTTPTRINAETLSGGLLPANIANLCLLFRGTPDAASRYVLFDTNNYCAYGQVASVPVAATTCLGNPSTIALTGTWTTASLRLTSITLK